MTSYDVVSYNVIVSYDVVGHNTDCTIHEPFKITYSSATGLSNHDSSLRGSSVYHRSSDTGMNLWDQAIGRVLLNLLSVNTYGSTNRRRNVSENLVLTSSRKR